MTTGKWCDPGVPHKGWICEGVSDLGEPSHICEMCEVMTVRYVHHMEHPEYGQLDVGCVCAGNMEEDPVGAREREKQVRNKSKRRETWLTRPWSLSHKGNEHTKTAGWHVTVFCRNNGWHGCLDHPLHGTLWINDMNTPLQVKLRAFDIINR